MWSLRRGAQLPRQRHKVEAFRVFGTKLDILGLGIGTNVVENNAACICKPGQTRWISHRCLSLKNEVNRDRFPYENFYVGHCGFSSRAGGECRGGESDDLEDEVCNVEHVNDGLSDIDMIVNGAVSYTETVSLKLFDAIVAAPTLSILNALTKWTDEGNNFNRPEIYAAILNLQKRRMYVKALELLEWVEATKRFELTEQEYASHLDLIAKLYGLEKAEKYIDKIPMCFRGEAVYSTLLANCVSPVNLKKAEKVFNKMREMEFPLTVFACNQMILLYKRLDKKKIANVIFFMERENVKPSLLTYKILIDTKGESNDIVGMEYLIKKMKAEGIDPDVQMHAIIARRYLHAGLTVKAIAVMEEIESKFLEISSGARGSLLRLYASLGKAEEVRRIWDACKLNPQIGECMSAIQAWGNLGEIEKAEAVFEKMLQTWKLSSRHYTALLKVYVENKLFGKGKEFVERMGDSRFIWIGPLTWNALVRLFVEARDVEKADSILHKAAQQNQMRPLFNSYMVVMYQYAKRGDVHNTEKLFHRMRQRGYTGRLRPFEILIQAYINADAPAYGLLERMKADNIFPNKPFRELLSQADAFKKMTVSSNLLD